MTAVPESPDHVETARARLRFLGLVQEREKPTLSHYEAVFPRRPNHRRRHYRVESSGRILCHLIVGPNLSRVHDQAARFFDDCPALVCRPLHFWAHPDGTDYLFLEHFDGESLDDAVLGGRCSEAQWLSTIRRAQKLLADTAQPSSRTELEREISRQVDAACDFPGLSRIDLLLLRELAASALLAGGPPEGLPTRWSNRDFIGRNLLINPSGEFRLIDYEHADRTHFWNSDWLRLVRFSNPPPGLDQGSIPELSPEHLEWHEIFLWLQNLAQLGEAEPSEPVVRHTASVIRLLFDAIGRFAGQSSSDTHRSLLLNTIGGLYRHGTGAWAGCADRKTLEVILAADLEQANHRLLTKTRRLVQQEAITRGERGEAEKQRWARKSLQAEVTRLQDDLRRAQHHLDRQTVNPAPPPTPCLFGVDQPGPLNAVEGMLRLSGWIVGDTPEPRQVRLRLEGDQTYDCQTGIPRPDVAAAHPDRAENLSSGFSLGTLVPAGFHLGALEQRTPSSAWIPFGSLSLTAGISPMIARLETAISPSQPEGDCPISGWCFHPQAEIDSLVVRFGPTTALLAHGLARPDVAASYPSVDAAGRSGFRGVIQLESGRGDVTLLATLRDGSIMETILARDISVPNAALEQATRDLFVPPPVVLTGGPAPTCQPSDTLHFGPINTVEPFLAGGWGGQEGGFRWAIGPKAGLRLQFPTPEKPRKLRIVVVPFIVPGRVDRQRINVDYPPGAVPATIELTQGIPREIIIELPATTSPSKEFELQFGFPDACRPKDFGLSEDIRLLSAGFLELTVS